MSALIAEWNSCATHSLNPRLALASSFSRRYSSQSNIAALRQPVSCPVSSALCSTIQSKQRVTLNHIRRLPYSSVRIIPQYRKSMAPGDSKKPAIDYKIPRPSSSVILISPQNEVLLLHRVKTSSSFPSAHVFPGGNISSQDGDFPPAGHPDSHDDGIHYRRAAIREMFEESGILLAKNKATGRMVKLSPTQKEEGRHAIHRNEITFEEWLKSIDANAEPDTDHLIPFSHWITPSTNARRFTTQMYLYFLPPANGASSDDITDTGLNSEEAQVPTSDGGIEVTEAQFLPATEWLRRAKADEVIMFPPQVLLLSFVAQFLERAGEKVPISAEESTNRREELIKFVHSGTPAWTHKFISPRPLGGMPDGRLIMDLNHPGKELEETEKRGDPDRVILVKFKKEGPRGVEVRWLSEVEAHLEDHKSSI